MLSKRKKQVKTKTIISIYPDENGLLNIYVNKDTLEVSFKTKSKNIFVITALIQAKLFVCRLKGMFLNELTAHPE